jgi:hypothetical protein
MSESDVVSVAMQAAQPFVDQPATKANLAKLRYAVRVATGHPVKCDLEQNSADQVEARRGVEIAVLAPGNWLRLTVSMFAPQEARVTSPNERLN